MRQRPCDSVTVAAVSLGKISSRASQPVCAALGVVVLLRGAVASPGDTEGFITTAVSLHNCHVLHVNVAYEVSGFQVCDSGSAIH